MYNVISHENTTKNSWNLPIDKMLDVIINDNKKEILIITQDPVITRVLRKEGFNTYSIYSHAISVDHQLIKKVYIIRTCTGPRPPEVFNPLMSSLENFEHSAQFVKTYKLGEDHYYSIKQKLDPSYPQFSLQMDVYEGKLSPNSLIEWKKKIY